MAGNQAQQVQPRPPIPTRKRSLSTSPEDIARKNARQDRSTTSAPHVQAPTHGESTTATAVSAKDSKSRVQSGRCFPFLDLPRELRDIIYHKIWMASLVVNIPHNHAMLSVRYCQAPPSLVEGDDCMQEDWFSLFAEACKVNGRDFCPFLPTWLLTHKTMLKEGMEQFLRQHPKWAALPLGIYTYPRQIDRRKTLPECTDLSKLPTWLLKSDKRCLDEALTQFRRQRKWVLGGHYSGPDWIEEGKLPPLLAPSTARSLVIHRDIDVPRDPNRIEVKFAADDMEKAWTTFASAMTSKRWPSVIGKFRHRLQRLSISLGYVDFTFPSLDDADMRTISELYHTIEKLGEG
ncbi:hypothetical protein BCR34DRAFT_615889 [Clohesyomyces aquaticus]|uniref:Uncharacterized protein n=1 Tax=Clohesyomyces aquaticus TaxID=1231657 RepID=A0A1Y1ZG90_9PLEO|nr:hypothetical protein BCR34DRAFT_615889 [Clohesyomyces aquaticus]